MLKPSTPIGHKGQKRKQAMIQAARRVFIDNGFEGTTLDMIIELSGGSRSSLYTHFGDKEGLYIAVVQDTIESIFLDMEEVEIEPSLRGVLEIHGKRFLNSILNPETLSLFRLIVSETDRFPKLGEIFYKIGPEKTYTVVFNALRTLPELAYLSNEQLYRFACHFVEMVKGDVFMKALCIKNYVVTQKEIDQSLQLSVSLMCCSLPQVQVES